MAGSPSEGGLKSTFMPGLCVSLGALPSLAWASHSNFVRAATSPAAFALDGTVTSSLAFGTLIAGISLAVFFVWRRERRLRAQRRRLRQNYMLGEEILGAASPVDILARLTGALPEVLGITRVHLYIYNRGTKTLDSLTDDSTPPDSLSLSSPPAGPQTGAVACFHYRTLLAIPDLSRSPFPLCGGAGPAPKSLLFVPMLTQGEVTGILELDQDDRARTFDADEQALAQHLGNQVGVALRLLDQRSVQEQLFRTEKLAAVGRLISGVVNELQTPLNSISELAARAVERSRLGPVERDVAAIASEARKAAAMVARLVSFAAAEQGEARPVAISTLLHNLIEFREGDWKASGIRVRDLTTREPLYVQGLQGQLEQIFLNLLVHAEQSLASAPQKTITVRTSVLGKRLLVEVSFSAPPEVRKVEETAAVLGVTRSVIAGHGGEVRLIEKPGSGPRPVEWRRAGADRAGRFVAAVDGPVDRVRRRSSAPDPGPLVRPRLPRGSHHQRRHRSGIGPPHPLRRRLLLGSRTRSELGGTFREDAVPRGRFRAAIGRFRRRPGHGFRGRRALRSPQTRAGSRPGSRAADHRSFALGQGHFHQERYP
jgi:GAF domain-containing protein